MTPYDPDQPAAPRPKDTSPTAVQVIAAVVILMVLGAIIMPFPSKHASDVVNRQSCASHMKIIGLALLQYSEDYDGNFPYGRADGSGMGWAGLVQPYEHTLATQGVKREGQNDAAENAWVCPSDPTGPDRSIDPTGLAVSYALNATLTGDKQLPNCSTKSSRMTAPNWTVMLFEVRDPIVQVERANEGSNGKPVTGWFSAVGNGMANALQKGGVAANLDAFGPVHYETGDIGGRGCSSLSCLPPRHQGGAIYLAADGHFILLLPARVSSGNTPAKSSPQTGGLADGFAASTDNGSGKDFELTFSAI